MKRKKTKQPILQKNPWITATVILGIMLLTIILYTTITEKMEDGKLLKINEHIKISSENLCYFYEEFGLNEPFELCNIENNQCVNIQLTKNPCEESE